MIKKPVKPQKPPVKLNKPTISSGPVTTDSKTSYADRYRAVDFRKHPECYAIGRGEQGVLIAEPYKSEIVPYWRFATPEVAEKSAIKILSLFEEYKTADDFVGMDMARKFLQMGFTRARRYANHASGNKYDAAGRARPQDGGSETSIKAESARIFKAYYDKARTDQRYLEMKATHIANQHNS